MGHWSGSTGPSSLLESSLIGELDDGGGDGNWFESLSSSSSPALIGGRDRVDVAAACWLGRGLTS